MNWPWWPFLSPFYERVRPCPFLLFTLSIPLERDLDGALDLDLLPLAPLLGDDDDADDAAAAALAHHLRGVQAPGAAPGGEKRKRAGFPGSVSFNCSKEVLES